MLQEPSQYKHQLTQDQLKEWFDHPVTKIYRDVLKENQNYLIESCGMGFCLTQQEVSIEAAYYSMQENIKMLKDLHSESIFEGSRFVEVLKDEESNEESN